LLKAAKSDGSSFIVLFYLNRLPFPYVSIFFRLLTLDAKHALTDVTFLLGVTPFKEMASVFEICLRSLQLGGLDG